MIVDVHVHALSRGGRDPLPEIQRQCRLNGVARILVSLAGSTAPYPTEEEVRRANEGAADLVERSGGLGRLLGYLSVQNANWREELDVCLGAGAVGVKLLTSLKGPDGRTDSAIPVLRELGRRGLSVLIHTFQKTQGNGQGEITIPEFAALAEACPDTRLIGAHAGGNWRHSLGVLRDGSANAHVDVSGYYPERGLVEALVADLGAERVVFGSDMVGRTQAGQLAKVEFADIDAADKERILGDNAARLFGLDEAAPLEPAPLRPADELPDMAVEHFCFVGRWPFYEGPWVDAEELDALLGEAGIGTAYTGDLEALFRQDLERVNQGFLAAARCCRRIAPLAALNPLAPNCRSTLRHLSDGFAGAIVFPYLHAWRLDDEAHAPLFRALADARLPVWINGALADDRARHTGLASRPVHDDEVLSFCQSAPANEYVFQGLSGAVAANVLAAGVGAGRFRFDVSKLTDYGYAWDELVGRHGLDSLVMGSEFPLRHLQEVRWACRRV